MRFTSIPQLLSQYCSLWRSPDARRTTTLRHPRRCSAAHRRTADSGDTFGLTSANRLVTFNRATPAVRTAVAVSGLQVASSCSASTSVRAARPPASSTHSAAPDGIYTINITNGAATLKSTLAADSDRHDRSVHRTRRHRLRRGLQPRRRTGCASSATPARTCASTSTPAPRSPTARSTPAARRAWA